jgi:hypothetical protein
MQNIGIEYREKGRPQFDENQPPTKVGTKNTPMR